MRRATPAELGLAESLPAMRTEEGTFMSAKDAPQVLAIALIGPAVDEFIGPLIAELFIDPPAADPARKFIDWVTTAWPQSLQ